MPHSDQPNYFWAVSWIPQVLGLGRSAEKARVLALSLHRQIKLKFQLFTEMSELNKSGTLLDLLEPILLSAHVFAGIGGTQKETITINIRIMEFCVLPRGPRFAVWMGRFFPSLLLARALEFAAVKNFSPSPSAHLYIRERRYIKLSCYIIWQKPALTYSDNNN